MPGATQSASPSSPASGLDRQTTRQHFQTRNFSPRSQDQRKTHSDRLLGFILLVVIVVIELHALRYAYAHIGLGSRTALLVLASSLAGSYFNIPVTQLPARQILSRAKVPFFGVHYVIPVTIDWPGTLIAINVGGSVIPVLVSLYLLITH